MEEGDGPELVEKYGVDAFPTLIIADADGKIITYTKGYINPRQLLDFGKYGITQSQKLKYEYIIERT